MIVQIKGNGKVVAAVLASEIKAIYSRLILLKDDSRIEHSDNINDLIEQWIVALNDLNKIN